MNALTITELIAKLETIRDITLRKDRTMKEPEQKKETIMDGEMTACPLCGHDASSSALIECHVCGEKVCTDCIHGNNPVEYDWESDPDGVSRMTGEGDVPSGADDSTAIVEAFGHIAESIVDGERIASGGDAKWLRPLAAMLAARIPFVCGSVESGLSVDITSSEFLDCCRSVWIGADMHRGFGRYLNLRWDVGRREWVEASSGFAFVGADSQVAFMLETAMAENDGIRFDPMEGEEDAIQLFRLLLETAKSADIPVSWRPDAVRACSRMPTWPFAAVRRLRCADGGAGV